MNKDIGCIIVRNMIMAGKAMAFLLIYCFFSVANAQQQDCASRLRSAREYRDRGDYVNAVKMYRKVEKTCPNYDGRVAKELVECQKILSDKHPVFVLKQSRIECSGQGGVVEMGLVEAPAAWTVSQFPEWLQVEDINVEEKQVRFNAIANPRAEKRTGTITLKCDKGKKVCTVIQQEGEPYLNVTSESLFFGGGGGQQNVTVDANFKWSYRASAPWIRLSKKDDRLIITCSANGSNGQRNAAITISGKDMNQVINVTQLEGGTLLAVYGIENHTVSFESQGGENDQIRVSSAEDWHVENDLPWVNVKRVEDAIVVQCQSNPWAEARTASFKVVSSVEGQEKTILVEQAGAEPKLTKISLPYRDNERNMYRERRVYNVRSHFREVHVMGDAGTLNVKVYSNIPNWSYRVLPDDAAWLTAEASPADSLLKLNIADNNESVAREALVLVEARGMQDTLCVKQSKRGYRGLIKDYFDGPERTWKTTRFFVDVYALESIGLRVGGLAKRWKFVEFSLLVFDVEYAHKKLFLDWEPIVRGYLPVSSRDCRWTLFMGMGISVNLLNLVLAPKVKFSYLGTPHFLFEVGAEFQWRKRDDLSSRIFYRYDGFSSFGISFDFYQWHRNFLRK